jgi:hypothetical protein
MLVRMLDWVLSQLRSVLVRMLAVFTSPGGGSSMVGECAGVDKIDLIVFIINLSVISPNGHNTVLGYYILPFRTAPCDKIALPQGDTKGLLLQKQGN